MLNSAGCVIIGRNEGDRLVRCLDSVCAHFALVVYVDSGSTDQSVENARQAGAKVVQLDMDKPFTAARARNTGLDYLVETLPSLEYVQFIDGDCELISSWPEAALSFLEKNEGFAIVCGRRRERYPEASIYNFLCDAEWGTCVGETSTCGGDAFMRITALKEVSAYNPTMIAGEEPEMCHRLVMKGWKIFRLDHEMTLHDANINTFKQWWNRTARSGYAYSLGYFLHRKSSQKMWERNFLRMIFWGGLLPFFFILMLPINMWFVNLVIVLYIYNILKGYISSIFNNPKSRLIDSLFMLLSKFANMYGAFLYFLDLLKGSRRKIIEYK